MPDCAAHPALHFDDSPEPRFPWYEPMITFLASFSSQIRYYLNFYREFAASTWDHMTPMQYGTLLIGIGVFGWLLMKTAFK